MTLLLTGLALFLGIHLLLSLSPAATAALRQQMGANAVKGLVAVGAALGLVLLVLGWRSATVQAIYTPPSVLHFPAVGLMLISVWLFALANRPSAVKQVLRHPQLTGLLLWSLAHLALNGDSLSLLLFGSLAVWSVLEMLLINRRDGAYVPPAAPPLKTDLVTAAIAVVGFALLSFLHPWLAGVPVVAHS